MAVKFELYKTPMPKERKNKIRYHARPVSFETVNTEELASRIHSRCTLRESDVIATLGELKYEVAQCLKEGKKVHIEGLGFLQVTLSCEEEIRDPRTKRVHKVKLKAIKFKADKELKAELRSMCFERSKIKRHSAEISELEIDMKLTDYFAENQIMTRKDLQYLCHMTQITAYRHIKRLIEEKKLQNLGTSHQPIYTPVPGNYRVSVAVKYKI
ncbi:HU family DNA-binding protein [uncultured Bacteroides sp.]|uniref:HU family DNA-binding protein n=1 Tax=uncultured Bacteroides sp. TaxID=162156 RepID=UPI002AA8DEA0|nr:HU family DNA-binding protein [uncultured Bacteroides sp.]